MFESIDPSNSNPNRLPPPVGWNDSRYTSTTIVLIVLLLIACYFLPSPEHILTGAAGAGVLLVGVVACVAYMIRKARLL
jgi:hypothetical protein